MDFGFAVRNFHPSYKLLSNPSLNIYIDHNGEIWRNAEKRDSSFISSTSQKFRMCINSSRIAGDEKAIFYQ